MQNGFELSIVLPCKPEELFQAWLSTNGHAALTGSPARVDGKVGGAFSAWDGYIFGTTLELDPPRRILQAWRTSEFSITAPDSHLELLLDAVPAGTKLTLIHTDMPEDQVDEYRQGWEDYYFKPMREYFG